MSNLVPHGWNECCLKDVSTVITKGTTPTTYGSGYTQSGVKFIRVENISNSGFISENDLKFISVETHEMLKRSQLQAGDLLVSIAGAIGRSAIVGSKNIPANTNQAVGIVRLRSDEIIPDFARYSIESPVVAKQINDSQAGNAQVNLNLEQLGGLRLYRPPLPEQQKIATILSSVDDVIEKTRAQIDKLKDLKTGMMQELLTKGIGHTEFKDSPVGLVPDSWVVRSLQQVITLTSGKAKVLKELSAESKNTPIPVYGGNGINGYCADYLLNERSIVIGRVGEYCGVVHLSRKKSWITDNALYVKKLSQGYDLKFIFYQLVNASLGKLRSKGGQPLISQTPIYELELAFPPLPEQVKIASVLQSLDKRIEQVSLKYSSFQRAKKALMQDLLTGKVRVKLTDKESAVV